VDKFATILFWFSAIILLNGLLGGCATEYLVEYWATLIKGRPFDLPFAAAFGVGIFLAEVTIPLAILTWCISFFM
jgi:hypothetical protein